MRGSRLQVSHTNWLYLFNIIASPVLLIIIIIISQQVIDRMSWKVNCILLIYSSSCWNINRRVEGGEEFIGDHQVWEYCTLEWHANGKNGSNNWLCKATGKWGIGWGSVNDLGGKWSTSIYFGEKQRWSMRSFIIPCPFPFFLIDRHFNVTIIFHLKAYLSSRVNDTWVAFRVPGGLIIELCDNPKLHWMSTVFSPFGLYQSTNRPHAINN